jgi:hypothetical protein
LGRPFLRDGFEPAFSVAGPCDQPGCAASTNPSLSFAHRFSLFLCSTKEDQVRHIVDVHRDFCEVAIVEAGEVRSPGRIETKPEVLELFARSLDRKDEVALEVTGPASHGRISRQGSAPARNALVEASWSAVRQPGPLRAFYERVRARRGHQIAIVGAARKLACLSGACSRARRTTPSRSPR